ncbi:MAG: aminodeoxychorismate synthase component I [Planctomycetes bacterium]|nr:aminodeoxychorismate synthase component I [Planctomycetota bacterium]
MTVTLPLVQELSPPPPVELALRAVADLPGVVLFDSALVRERLGRHSFLTADPFERFDVSSVQPGCNPFGPVREALQRFATAAIPELPPFQGGAAGMLGYELGRAWEVVPRAAADEFELPVMSLGLYDWTIGWDHTQGRAWLVSHGFPATGRAQHIRARARLDEILVRVRAVTGSDPFAVQPTPTGCNPWASSSAKGSDPFPPEQLAPHWPLPGAAGVVSNFGRESYLAAVGRVIEYIRAGDIFQANLSQRLLSPLAEHPLELYLRLRQRNPAPFAGYFAADDWAVASASPERFLCVRDGEVETRPIKGTRRRGFRPEADLFTRDELRESEKDTAENVMIVDLLRNDLSRVCRPGSVRVPRLCAVETYETVQHLVSEVRGTLMAGRDVWDLLAAAFPGGSITGAPKVRAMEIIAELEPTVRGPYCGSLLYVGFDGNADSSILIRTFTCRRGWVQFPVGGGIVAQSHPAAEYDETLDKAAGMLRALR